MQKLYSSKDFPSSPVVKSSPSNAGDTGSVPGQGEKAHMSRIVKNSIRSLQMVHIKEKQTTKLSPAVIQRGMATVRAIGL